MPQPKKKIVVLTIETDTYSTKAAMDAATKAHDAIADLKVGNSGVRVTGVAVK